MGNEKTARDRSTNGATEIASANREERESGTGPMTRRIGFKKGPKKETKS